MGFSQAISTCMAKYFTFSGRAGRSEFWWFYLFTILISWGASVVFVFTMPEDPVMASIMINLVTLVFGFPVFAAGSRRLHDIGKSGWWQLLTLTIIGIILLIIWWATDSQKEDNQYGSYLQE